MFGCCFLVSEYTKEYRRRNREEDQAAEKRSFEMRESVLVCSGESFKSRSDERDTLPLSRGGSSQTS